MLWEHTKTSRTCLPNSSSRTINWADNIVAIQEIEPGRKQCCDTELWMCRRVTSSGPLRHWETGNSTAYGRLGQRPQGRMNSILSWKLVVPHFVPEIWMNRKTKSLNIKCWQKCSSWAWGIINGMMASGSTSRHFCTRLWKRRWQIRVMQCILLLHTSKFLPKQYMEGFRWTFTIAALRRRSTCATYCCKSRLSPFPFRNGEGLNL